MEVEDEKLATTLHEAAERGQHREIVRWAPQMRSPAALPAAAHQQGLAPQGSAIISCQAFLACFALPAILSSFSTFMTSFCSGL